MWLRLSIRRMTPIPTTYTHRPTTTSSSSSIELSYQTYHSCLYQTETIIEYIYKTRSQIMAASTETETKSPVPYHQIRALYDEETITVYQAYSPSIALSAVQHQKLNASPDFKMGRMTWIKPSWCWMMYRSGYSFKDSRQSKILALKMRHEDFERLLREAVVCHGQT